MTVHWISEFTVPTKAGVHVEDDGDMLILYHPLDETIVKGNDGAFFIRLQSWDDTNDTDAPEKHPLLHFLMGKRVRVTVEVIDQEVADVAVTDDQPVIEDHVIEEDDDPDV